MKELKTDHTISHASTSPFLLSSLALAAFESLPAKLLRAAAPVFKALPAWMPGILEIHQIATNRGNSTLLTCPTAPP